MKSVFNRFTLATVVSLPISLFSVLAFGFSNPQIRNCHISGGRFIVVNTSNDQVGLCKLGSGIIGALDIVLLRADEPTPQSIESYKAGVQTCAGALQTVTSLENNSYNICFFNDGSAMEAVTLKSGINAPQNEKLNRALNL
jgi:putative hemolysin